MKKYFIDSYKLLKNDEKKEVTYFFILTIVSLILETLSIGALYPLLSVFVADDINDKFPFIKIILDYFNINNSSDIILIFVSIFVLLAFLIKNIFLIYFLFWHSNFYRNLRVRIKSDLLKIYNYETYNFHLQNNSSNLVRNITLTTDQAITNIYNCMMIIIEGTIFLALCTLLFFIQSEMIFFLLFVIGVPTIIFVPIIKSIVGKWGEIVISYQGRAMKALLQSFSMIKEIKIFNKEIEFVNHYANEEKQAQNYIKKSTILKNIPRFFFETLILISIIGYIFLQSKNHSIALSSLIPELGILIVTVLRIYPSINKIIFSLNKLSQNHKAVKIITTDLNNYKNSTETNYDKISFVNEIKFENLCFSYLQKKNILKNLNISIKKGEYIGIFGKSGSGKSTFLDILLGLFIPSSGKIFVDNKEINLCSRSWRNKIGYIPQVVNLIDENLLKNICLETHQDKIDYDHFYKIIRQSNLENFLKYLPEKEFTYLGERGSKISGGEKQRIGIARALYRKSEILVLDESTNSIDFKTKKIVLETINMLKKEKTIISVSHELEDLKYCDIIYEMNDGYLVKK